MSKINCFACSKEMLKEELLKCVTCSGTYHYQCLNMTSSYFVEHYLDIRKSWRCPSCDNITRRRKGVDTPVRTRLDTTSQQLDMSCDDLSGYEMCATASEPVTVKSTAKPSVPAVISYQQFADLLDSKLEYMKACLSKEIRNEINSAIEKFKSEFSATTDFLSGKISDLNKEITGYKNKFKDLETENLSLKKSISQIQIELNAKEQLSLANDIQITGIPEYENESLTHIVIAVASKIGVKIEESDIVSSTRVGPKRPTNTSSQTIPARPIVLRFVRRLNREELLKNARVRRGSTTSDLGLPPHEPRRFYVNERLTKTNRQIFVKARDAARAAIWRFVWTRDGKIYARRSVSSEVHLLQSEKDVDRVFAGTDDTFHTNV